MVWFQDNSKPVECNKVWKIRAATYLPLCGKDLNMRYYYI